MKDLKEIRIVYMGTPEFAVAPLKYMVDNGLKIVGVVTAPDKPAGRGMQLQQSDVKQYAVANNLLVLQPEKLKAQTFIDDLKALDADVQVVVAFRMLPEIVWSMPPMGTLNLHASLLPQYRGAAPINWAIINGESETGLTTFLLQHEIDTGNILMQQKMEILASDNVGSLYKKLMDNGGKLIYETLAQLAANKIEPKPQSEFENAKHAPKIFKQDCEIDFLKPAFEVHNFIRGLSPYPGAYTHAIDNKLFKIYDTIFSNENDVVFENENFKTDGKTFLKVKCAKGYIEVLEIQMEGKKRMPIKTFLQGYNFDK